MRAKPIVFANSKAKQFVLHLLRCSPITHIFSIIKRALVFGPNVWTMISFMLLRSVWCGTRTRNRASSQYNDRLSGYRDFHYKDKTVVRPSYLYNGNSYSGKTTSVHWHGPRSLAIQNKTYELNWYIRGLCCTFPGFFLVIDWLNSENLYNEWHLFQLTSQVSIII